MCTLPQATFANWQYAMVVQCSSSSVTFGSSEVVVTKNVIGIVVVFFDLLITFFFWCSLISLDKLQLATEEEVNAGTVVP